MYTLGDISRKGARIRTHKEAVVFGDNRLTYGQLNDRVNRLANAFLSMKCEKGQRIAILSENSHKYLEVYFGAAKAGLVIVPLNFRLSPTEISQIVNDSGPTVFLAGDGYEALASSIKHECSTVNMWIALDNPTDGYNYYEDLIDNARCSDPEVLVGENELAVLMYTGGTTGLPKGVMLSHRNLLSSTLAFAHGFQFSELDTTCMLLPIFHASIWPALCCLMVGGKVVITRRAEMEVILRAIQDENCTHVNAVPTIYNWLLDYPDLNKFNVSSLRLITYAGSPMPVEVLRRCIQKFGNIMGQAYGMTEAAPLVSILMPYEHAVEGPKARLLMSAGRESVTVDVSVVGEDGKALKSGEIGEITVRGANVTMGYWNNRKLTQEKIRDGWLHTGDLGKVDEEGYLYLVDRKADMIITGGENVYPTETENILYQHPAIQECTVVSAPDQRWGERVQAVVVLKSDMSVTEEELIAFCKQRLAGYKCPKKIEFWEQIPKSPVGKILRKDVKKKFWEGSDRYIS
jgi:acyl-CoA synthetase (AMP-forming)/AMP-acid ligase II